MYKDQIAETQERIWEFESQNKPSQQLGNSMDEQMAWSTVKLKSAKSYVHMYCCGPPCELFNSYTFLGPFPTYLRWSKMVSKLWFVSMDSVSPSRLFPACSLFFFFEVLLLCFFVSLDVYIAHTRLGCTCAGVITWHKLLDQFSNSLIFWNEWWSNKISTKI